MDHSYLLFECCIVSSPVDSRSLFTVRQSSKYLRGDPEVKTLVVYSPSEKLSRSPFQIVGPYLLQFIFNGLVKD